MKCFGFCFLSTAPMRREASHSSEMVTQMIFGDSMEVDKVTLEWVHGRMLYDGYEGWVSIKQVALLNEVPATDYVTERETRCVVPAELCGKRKAESGERGGMEVTVPAGASCRLSWLKEPVAESRKTKDTVELAKHYLGAPYLWGGRTVWGVDCSGLVQIVHKVFGIALPRDVSQQVECGREVVFKEARRGDLAFFNDARGKLTHVGLVAGYRKVIHSSGYVRIDELHKKGIFNSEAGVYTHHLHSIRRIEG